MLSSLNIMDYSVLIGIRKNKYKSVKLEKYEIISYDRKYIYSISIIDIL